MLGEVNVNFVLSLTFMQHIYLVMSEDEVHLFSFTASCSCP